jgi:hypothetical protein
MSDQRFRKPFSPSYSSLFQLAAPNENQELEKWTSPDFVDIFQA